LAQILLVEIRVIHEVEDSVDQTVNRVEKKYLSV